MSFLLSVTVPRVVKSAWSYFSIYIPAMILIHYIQDTQSDETLCLTIFYTFLSDLHTQSLACCWRTFIHIFLAHLSVGRFMAQKLKACRTEKKGKIRFCRSVYLALDYLQETVW